MNLRATAPSLAHIPHLFVLHRSIELMRSSHLKLPIFLFAFLAAPSTLSLSRSTFAGLPVVTTSNSQRIHESEFS